jgi:hypothetical protein
MFRDDEEGGIQVPVVTTEFREKKREEKQVGSSGSINRKKLSSYLGVL